MPTVAEAFDHADLRVVVEYEEHIEEFFNPRSDVDGLLGVMFTEHSRYNLGGDRDHTSMPDELTVTCPHCGGDGESPERSIIVRIPIVETRDRPRRVVAAGSPECMEAEWMRMIEREDDFYLSLEPLSCPRCEGEGEIEVGLLDYFKAEYGTRVMLPLYLYDHSGISMSVGGFADQWDSGMVGVICDTAETRKACGCEDWTDERIETNLKAEVELYDLYLTGQVFHVEVRTLSTDDDDEDAGDVLEGCGGFLGEADAIENGKSMAEGCRSQIEQRIQDDVLSMPVMGA